MATSDVADVFYKATKTAQYLKKLIPPVLDKPTTGIICGSGLGGLSSAVWATPRLEIQYEDIPGFPQSTVHGHVGKLLFGLLGRELRPVVLMVGRAHFYEGHSITDVAFPIRVLKLLGVDTLIITNAAGGLNPKFAVGDLVILSDHLNLAGLTGINPLRGPNVNEFGVRFPPLSDAYDLDLRRRAHRTWNQINEHQTGRQLHEGVYAFVGGPSYETRAECRLLHSLGADIVGMSTVPEIIVARHCGIRILAVSLVTNNAVLEPGPAGDDASLENFNNEALLHVSEIGRASHEEVIEAGKQAAGDMQRLICQVIEGFSSSY